MPAWRLIQGAGTDRSMRAVPGARNMAVDHALLESVQGGGRPVLRLYRWDPPCLSLGRNQHARGVFDPERARSLGIDFVRRPTGGLAVLHDHELTYSVLAPLTLFGGPRAAYASINAAVIRALQDLGVAAEAAGGRAVRSPRTQSAAPCFGEPAPGEVTVDGRKLVGSAQRCEHRTLLQHGSILLGGSQDAVEDLLVTTFDARPAATREPPAATARGAATAQAAVTLADLLPAPPSTAVLADRLRSAFEETFGTRLAPESLTREERARAGALEVSYGDATWTWRQ